MAEKLGPTRVLAILPISIVEGNNRRQQAEVCRGIACFLDRRFSRVNGLETFLPQTGSSRRSSSENGLPLEFAHRHARAHQPTHILRGYTNWGDDDYFNIRFEILDLSSAGIIFEETADVPFNREGLEAFFRLMGGMTERLTGSVSMARLMARLPTRSARAFRHYLSGLAAADSWRRGLADSQRCFDYLLDALRFDPSFSDAIEVLSRLAQDCIAEEGDEAFAAVTALQRAVELSPDDADLLGRLGLALRELRNDAQARDCLKKYLDRAPRGELAPRCMASLADIERRMGHREEAVKLLRHSLYFEPDAAERWEALGDLFEEAHDSAGAASSWRRALQEDPDRRNALAKLAKAHLRLGEHAQARFLLERLLSLHPRNEEARRLLLQSLLDSNDLDEANSLATSWAETDSTAFRPWILLAQVRHRLGHRDAVEFCLEKALPTSKAEEEELRQVMVDMGLIEEIQPRISGGETASELISPATPVPMVVAEAPEEVPTLPQPSPPKGFLQLLLESMKLPFSRKNRRK